MPNYYLDEDGLPLICPPHLFDAGWTGGDETHGVIYCRYCGEIRDLKLAEIEAPVEEMYSQELRDYGEPT